MRFLILFFPYFNEVADKARFQHSIFNIFMSFPVQEKVESLTERLERESVIGDRTGGNDDNDGASTKGAIKSKCKF